MVALLPARVRRLCPVWWGAYPTAVLAGTFRGQVLNGASGLSAGAPLPHARLETTSGAAPAAKMLTKKEAHSMADLLVHT
eukprot:9899552-Lingulodinium_polyedra.AAC.1